MVDGKDSPQLRIKAVVFDTPSEVQLNCIKFEMVPKQMTQKMFWLAMSLINELEIFSHYINNKNWKVVLEIRVLELDAVLF